MEMCCSQRLGGIPHEHDLQSALALPQLSPVLLPWHFTCFLLLAGSLPDPQLPCWGMLLLEAGRGTERSCTPSFGKLCHAWLPHWFKDREVWAGLRLGPAGTEPRLLYVRRQGGMCAAIGVRGKLTFGLSYGVIADVVLLRARLCPARAGELCFEQGGTRQQVWNWHRSLPTLSQLSHLCSSCQTLPGTGVNAHQGVPAGSRSCGVFPSSLVER